MNLKLAEGKNVFSHRSPFPPLEWSLLALQGIKATLGYGNLMAPETIRKPIIEGRAYTNVYTKKLYFSNA